MGAIRGKARSHRFVEAFFAGMARSLYVGSLI